MTGSLPRCLELRGSPEELLLNQLPLSSQVVMCVSSSIKSLTTCGDLLHIGTLIAHHLLSHLEATWSKLRCPHLLSAVTFPLAGGFFGYRLVTYNLCERAALENITKTKYNGSKIAGSKSSDDEHLQ